MNLKDKVISIIPELEPHWGEAGHLFREKHVSARTVLLEEGESSKYLFMVSRGALRIYLIKNDGTEITVQFFFEKQIVASMESAFTGKPGRLYLESIEESEVVMIKLTDFRNLFKKHQELKDIMILFLQQRLLYYSDLYLSFIMNTPEERYVKLLEDNPGIIERVPHYFIATYLGITPVSLSRIRSRLALKSGN